MYASCNIGNRYHRKDNLPDGYRACTSTEVAPCKHPKDGQDCHCLYLQSCNEYAELWLVAFLCNSFTNALSHKFRAVWQKVC